MSKSLIEIKRASIQKELATATANAAEDAKFKEAKLMNELQYTQLDIEEMEKGWTNTFEHMEARWMWRCIALCALTAIISAFTILIYAHS